MSSVDIVVPCYNYGRFLRDCVASVLAQSHADLRVLIIDDASTDNTLVVATELAAEDSRVVVHRHAQNRGHVATYNEGIALAAADYMLILSADDFLRPGAIARAVAVMDERPDVGLTPGDWDPYRTGDPLPPDLAGTALVDVADTAAFVKRLARGNFIHTATAIVRTRVQKALGGYRFDLPHAGDLEMWLRFALNGEVAFIRAPQAVYRKHGDNMSLGYDAEADVRQCAMSFRLHYDEIRARVPDGAALVNRIRWIFAAKAARRALGALRHRRFAAFSRLSRMSLGEVTGRLEV